jgi:NAD(P)H-hydrate epimerase
MQKVLTAAEVREVDRLTTERYGIPSIILMENAAHATARVITEKLGGSVKDKSILILCGKGNNGGDGFALSRILWTMGANVTVCMMFPDDEVSGDAAENLHLLRTVHEAQGASGSPTIFIAEYGSHFLIPDNFECLFAPHLMVDALFGTGLTRPLEGDLLWLAKQFICDAVGGGRPIRLSMDIPSGLDSDSPQLIGESFAADVTVSFTAPKPANILPPAFRLNGELRVAKIGSPQRLIDEQPSQLFLAERDDAAAWLKKSEFSADSYKNKRGHSLIIAGSADYSGAAVLAANAAIRSGAGMVTLACPSHAKAEIASRLLPEVILTAIGMDEFAIHLGRADAVAVGCGLDVKDPDVSRIVRGLIGNRKKPTIVDAGALSVFSSVAGGYAQPPAAEIGPDLILTPHEGEFLRLIAGSQAASLQASEPLKDRITAVREFAVKHNCILVLKGERVLIGSPDGRVVVNPTGNSGLGKAGNGDTLAGILAGFVAQAAKMNIDIFETVVAAVYVAGMAGDAAEKKFGKRVMTASDVRECLVDVFAQFE